MGLSPMKSCSTNCCVTAIPNPNPDNWELLSWMQYDHGYVLKVKYSGCTNFEGIKIMVYRGSFRPPNRLDPHFADNDTSPIARFKPDKSGWANACALAMAQLEKDTYE